MANNFDFSIGISASDEGASAVIGGVITQMSDLENSMTSMANGGGIKEIMGGWDPTALMPAEDLMNELNDSMIDMRNRLDEISKHNHLCGIAICVEDADDAIKEATKTTEGWSQVMSEVPSKAMSVGEHFGRVGKAADLLQNSGSQLRHQMTRIYRGMGETAEAADLTASSVLTLANETKTSWQQVAQLQGRLAGAAIGMDDLKGSASENMKTMVLLNESFELSHDEVQRLAGSMKMTGGSLTKLAGTAVQFQKKFKVPGLINTLPAAAEAAIEAQSQFGSVVGKSSGAITTNILRMTGVYSKALGVTAAEAANKARGTFMKFTGEVESFEDLFLGLADDFTPLQTAFLETGISMGDMEDLMRKGATAPEEFASEVKKIRDSMDPQMGERFFRQVLRNTDEATRQLLTQEEAAKNANEAAAEGAAPDDPSATFDKIAKSMRENAVDAQKMHENLTGVATEMTKLAADEGVRQGLEAVNGLIQGVNTTLITQYEKVRQNKTEFAAMNKVIAGTTASMVLLNDAFAVWNKVSGTSGTLLLGIASAGSLLLKPFQLLWKGASKLFNLFKGSGAATRGAGGALKGFGKIIGKLALPVAVAIAAFDGIMQAVKDVGAVLSDPNKTGMEKFKGVVVAILGGVGTAINSFFLGLPGMFIDGFKNVGRATDTEGSRSMGKAIGSVLGTVLKAVVDFFTGLPETFSTGWDSITAWWGALNIYDDVFLPLVSGFAVIGDHILGFVSGALEGMLEAFGMTSDSAAQVVDALGTIIRVTFEEAFAWVAKVLSDGADYFMFFVSGITKGMSFISQGINYALEIIKSGFKIAFFGVKAVVMSVFSTIAGGWAEVADTILAGFKAVGDVLGFDTSGIDRVRGNIASMTTALDDAASSARSRVTEEINATGARLNAITEAGRLEREEITKTDAARVAAMDKRQGEFDTERQARAQTMGKAVDTLFGADPNAEANEAKRQAQEKELAEIRANRNTAYQQEVDAVVRANAQIKAQYDAVNAANRALAQQTGTTFTEAKPVFMDMPTRPQAPAATSGGTSAIAQRAGGTGATPVAVGAAAGATPTTAEGQRVDLNSTTTILLDGDKVAEAVTKRRVSQNGQGGGFE